MVLPGRLRKGRKKSARMGIPPSVSTQQGARSTVIDGTGRLYCPPYSVPRMVDRDYSSMVYRDRSSACDRNVSYSYFCDNRQTTTRGSSLESS